jgi:hypothetical protein
MKQFLLNPDGSVPPGVDVSVLEAEGIVMVLPTPRHDPAPGYDLAESDPVFDNGVWRQVWAEVALPPPQPVPVPERVEMAQARLALFQAGLLPQVDTAIDAIPDATQRETARIEWEYRSTVRRDSELVTGLGASLGLTDEQIGNLFRLADTL